MSKNRDHDKEKIKTLINGAFTHILEPVKYKEAKIVAKNCCSSKLIEYLNDCDSIEKNKFYPNNGLLVYLDCCNTI